MTTTWETPRFTDIAMNAEIGAYQDDADRGNQPISEREASAESRATATPY
jgi:hypothetical protein